MLGEMLVNTDTCLSEGIQVQIKPKAIKLAIAADILSSNGSCSFHDRKVVHFVFNNNLSLLLIKMATITGHIFIQGKQFCSQGFI
jgi:hypothetical protein